MEPGGPEEPPRLLQLLRKLKEVFDVCDEDADGFIRVEHFVALGLQFGQGDEVRKEWLGRETIARWGRERGSAERREAFPDRLLRKPDFCDLLFFRGEPRFGHHPQEAHFCKRSPSSPSLSPQPPALDLTGLKLMWTFVFQIGA
ncbi:rab11 family-interacting protein 4 [Crotalus adamanteus]|uniref:Rab11 family-interacting protein 4 n=1 Tax=Crotalus adamanteus TaxID=8729 RepID=A0AAW1BYL8_CROAD